MPDNAGSALPSFPPSLDEGPEIVDAIISIDPLAAKHVDNLGQVRVCATFSCQ